MSVTSAALAIVCVGSLAGSVGAPTPSETTAPVSGSPSLTYGSPGQRRASAGASWHPDACLMFPSTVALYLGGPCVHHTVLWRQARALERDPLR